MVMPIPRIRFTVRSMMMLVAVVAVLLAGIPVGMKLGLNLKEEVRARRAVVERIKSWLNQSNAWIQSREMRIARSEGQAVRDPRHERWLEELPEWRATAASCRRDLPVYERLARYPWLPFPKGRYDREYLSASEFAYINRFQDHRAAAIWSGAGAAAFVLGTLMLISLTLVARNRLSTTHEARA
jgi:hypothetical protein